jgi:hypothetical protein
MDGTCHQGMYIALNHLLWGELKNGNLKDWAGVHVSYRETSLSRTTRLLLFTTSFFQNCRGDVWGILGRIVCKFQTGERGGAKKGNQGSVQDLNF